MPQCQNCGTFSADSDSFCRQCGTSLKTAEQPSRASCLTPKPRSSAARIIGYCFTAVILLSILLLLIIGTVTQQESQQTAALTEQTFSKHPLIDLPKLAFQKQSAVNKLFGKPIATHLSPSWHGFIEWSEGPVRYVKYRGAECTYFRGLLVWISYRFKVRPQTAVEALELTGFPREAVSFDSHPNHLPFDAFYAPNRDYRNPIRCCGGRMFFRVMIQEGIDTVEVMYANTNEHFGCWPAEIRAAWLRAGGPVITGYTVKDARPVVLAPKDGNWLNAPLVSKDSDTCWGDPP